jgi:hypothetical protein
MKKIILLFIYVLSLMFAFSSCSDDSDSPEPATIEGKWNFNKMSVTINGITSPEIDYEGNEPGCLKDYIEFIPGGVLKEGDYYGSECALEIINDTWVKNGNKITVTLDGILIPLEVVSLTSSSLVVKYSESQDGMTLIINLSFVKA